MNRIEFRDFTDDAHVFCGHIGKLESRNIRNGRKVVKIQVYNEIDTLDIRLILRTEQMEEVCSIIEEGDAIKVCGSTPVFDIFENKKLMISVDYIEKLSD